MIKIRILIFVALLGMFSQANAKAYTNGCSINKMMFYLNDVRARPQFYAKRIREIWINNMVSYKTYGIALHTPSRMLYSKTVTWFLEAEKWMKAAKPCNTKYILDEGFTRVAWEHSQWMVTKNGQKNNHTGPLKDLNGKCAKGLFDRAKIYDSPPVGVPYGAAENINDCLVGMNYDGPAGKWTAEEFAILGLIVDHNVPSLGHRYNIMLKCDYNILGIGLYPYTCSKYGSKKDKATYFMGKGTWKCKNCPFSKAKRNEMCWSNWLKKKNSCDTSDL